MVTIRGSGSVALERGEVSANKTRLSFVFNVVDHHRPMQVVFQGNGRLRCDAMIRIALQDEAAISCYGRDRIEEQTADVAAIGESDGGTDSLPASRFPRW
jgi:hypothetical protein